MAWCGGLRADHGQKHDPGDEISFRWDLTNEDPLQKHYSCVLFELLNPWTTVIREVMDGGCIG